jgi:protein TonB
MGVTFTDVDDEDDFGETHEINVTPFIDVILVLLIIFMVAAPLSTVDLPVDLPTSSAMPQKKPDKPTYVSIKADLAVAIGESPVKRVDLVRTLDAADPNKDRRIFLRADRAVSYGDTMDVLELLREGLWIFAASLALCSHIALAAFAIAEMREEPDDDLGAPGIEIAFELASASTPPSDLPPGPESEASAASPPLVEQKATDKDVDLPKETPVEAEEPDRLVTVDKSKTPVEEEPDVKTTRVKPSEESVAQEATAAPTVENVPEAAKSTTRAQGTGESPDRARVTWHKELLAHLNKYKRYPTDRSQKSAEILVTMNLDRTGHVLTVNIARSSGDEVYDHAALAMVERASPVPTPPPLVADEGLSFSLPVIFRKKGR